MKFKALIHVIVLLLVLFASSCDYFTKKNNGHASADRLKTEIDSTLWLKETRGIRDILEDNQGHLWFSSPDYIARFNGKNMYYFSENDGLGITGNIHKDAQGTIWIENGFRAFRYQGKRFVEEQIDRISGTEWLWFQRGLDPTDSTYVQPGLYEVTNQNTIFYPLPVQENVKNKFLHLPTTKAIYAPDSTVWLGTMEAVYGFKNKSFTTIGRAEMGRQGDERQVGLRGIYVDSNGSLWIADNGAGIFKYNGQDVINFTRQHLLDEGDTRGSTLHRAFSVAEDPEGKLWFGTVYSGIWSYDTSSDAFKNYTEQDGVQSETIWTIYRTSKGELLFAGETPAAVYIFNGKTFDRKF